MTPNPTRRHLLTAALCAATLAAPAFAQTAWPTKPLRIVVGFPPGGVADVVSRVISVPLGEALGQPVIIENKSGANGNVAADFVAKSAADGYTLVMSSTGIESVNPALFAKMPYDPQKDLQPVAAAARIQLFLVVRPELGVSDVKAFVALAKSKPGKLSYGSAGSGSTPHLAGELFKQSANIFATHVPYRGAAPALQDVLAGQLDFYFDPGIGIPHIRAGRLKALGVASAKRSALFPDVPTFGELGYRGINADTLFGFYAPAAVPKDVVARLNREINKALALPAVRQKIADLGGEAIPMSPADFKQLAQIETALFGGVIAARGIKAD